METHWFTIEAQKHRAQRLEKMDARAVDRFADLLECFKSVYGEDSPEFKAKKKEFETVTKTPKKWQSFL